MPPPDPSGGPTGLGAMGDSPPEGTAVFRHGEDEGKQSGVIFFLSETNRGVLIRPLDMLTNSFAADDFNESDSK